MKIRCDNYLKLLFKLFKNQINIWHFDNMKYFNFNIYLFCLFSLDVSIIFI